MSVPELLAVARGEKAADLLLRNGALVNVFSGQIERADIAIFGGLIAGIGPGYHANEVVDLAGAFVAPGLIDAHVHIESSLCVPAQFAAAVVPCGVTCAVTDPHEIANVAGTAGIRYMARSARHLPIKTILMASSCVPATHMETSGAALNADDLAALLADGTVHGLAEVMNFPGVVHGDASVLAKIAAFQSRPIDGHAPALSGKLLNAYAAAGIGSEHECTTVEEAAEKLARGFYILIREATIAHNLHPLLPLITPANSRRIAFCTDDRIPNDILNLGTIDYMIREAIAYGINPIDAIRMGTLNAAEWFGLRDRGAIAPGRAADFVIFDSLQEFRAREVYVAGKLVAQNGQLLPSVLPEAPPIPESIRNTVKIEWPALQFRIPARGKQIRVIGAIENSLLTNHLIMDATIEDGNAVADPARDLLKIAVIERHKGQGLTGLGFIQGMGLQRGAIAGTVAHDHHNLVVIGADDTSMMAATRAVADMQGGLVVVEGEHILASLPLPVAGLMSDRPVAEVSESYDRLINAARSLGAAFNDPFMAMSFKALEVIPSLKLTDRGLIDVEKFDFVDLFV